MIEISKLILKKSIAANPIMKISLSALKLFGYMIFDDQKKIHRDFLRGDIFTLSFIIFNVTQVKKKLTSTLRNWKVFN